MFWSSPPKEEADDPCTPNPCDDTAVACFPILGEAYCKCPDEKYFFRVGTKFCFNNASPPSIDGVQEQQQQQYSNGSGPCSPNPCDDLSMTCFPILGEAYCKCWGEKDFFRVGTRYCSPRPNAKIAKPTNNNDNSNNPCANDTTNVGNCNEDVTTSNNYSTSSYTTGSFTTSSSSSTYSVASQLYDELCIPNPCSDDSTCFLMNQQPYCSCPDTARSAPAGETCPPPEQPFTAGDYVAIAIAGLIIIAGIQLCRRPAPASKTKREVHQEHRSSVYQGETEYESAQGLADLHMKEEEEELLQSHGTIHVLWQSRALIVVAAALWATNYRMLKDWVTIVPVGIAMSLRSFFPALVTLPRLLLRYDHEENEDAVSGDRWGLRLRGMESGIWLGVALICQALALRTLSILCQGFIFGTSVIFVPFFGALSGNPASTNQWVAVLLCMVGVSILTILIPGAIDSFESAALADTLIAFVVPIGFSLWIWRVGHAKDLYPGRSCLLATSQMQGILLSSVIYFLISENLTDVSTYPWTTEWLTDLRLWFYILWTGMVATLPPTLFIDYAVGTLQSSEAVVLFSIQQVFALIFASITFEERIGWELFFGAFCIIFASSLATRRNKPAKGLENPRSQTFSHD